MPGVTYSGFYGPNVGDYALLVGRMPMRTQIKRTVNMDGFRSFTALFNGLIGAAAGSNVTATHRRVDNASVINTVGTAVLDPGLPQVVTVTDINRNTTAADVAALKEMVYNVQTRPVPYARDLSGNGGPALA